MEIVTFWDTLIERARDLAEAKKSKDADRIIEADKKLKDYESLCLKSDRMIIPKI